MWIISTCEINDERNVDSGFFFFVSEFYFQVNHLFVFSEKLHLGCFH